MGNKSSELFKAYLYLNNNKIMLFLTTVAIKKYNTNSVRLEQTKTEKQLHKIVFHT